MSESPAPALGRRGLLAGCLVFAVLGAAAMAWLDWPALTSDSRYNMDLTQSPHWVAYHGDRFADDDLLVEYGAYNETPVQNALYWVGTWFIDIVPLSKVVAIAIFGLTAALFFLLVCAMSGPRVGGLAALCFIIFPRSAYEIAGGFSRAWAIGLVLVAVYVVETRCWRHLVWLMPLAALAYPVSPVLIGATVLVGLLLELPGSTAEAWRGLKYLCLSSGLALVPLFYKYLTPPVQIGEMISTREMKAIFDAGLSGDYTWPLWEDVLSFLEFPFFVYGAIALLMLLHRRGLVWKRSWSALVIASAGLYVVADAVIPRLYLPNRYTRFSIAVLLILWHAHNWDRAVEAFKRRRVQWAALAVVLGLAVALFPGSFRSGTGVVPDRLKERWRDRSQVTRLSQAMVGLSPPLLVAGHPWDLGDVMLQSRHPVLVIHRMTHSWFSGYVAQIDTRIRDIFRAMYARDAAQVNLLAERYGVTHLVLRRNLYTNRRLRTGQVYEEPYDEFVRGLIRGQTQFALRPPPRDAILYEDDAYWIVRLPLREGPSSGNVPRGQGTGPAGQSQR